MNKDHLCTVRISTVQSRARTCQCIYLRHRLLSKTPCLKADPAVHRTCTVGLMGPWGESTWSTSAPVFLRVTFTFPLAYPTSIEPSSDPLVDIERNPLVPPSTRAFLVRRLKSIRNKRPCLEECIQFLLGSKYGRAGLHESDSSGDEAMTPSHVDLMQGLGLARGNEDIRELGDMPKTLDSNGSQAYSCVSESH